jgi:hypothetical protein
MTTTLTTPTGITSNVNTIDYQEQIYYVLSQMLQNGTGVNKVEITNSGKITTSSGTVELNASYYHDIVIILVNGTTTDTNVYVSITTEQVQSPGVYKLNSSIVKLRLRGVQATRVSTDSSLGSATLYVYYIGYNKPIQPMLKMD